MKKIKIIFLFLALFSIGAITGCNDSTDDPKDETNDVIKYTVSFYNSDGSLIETKEVEANSTVSLPSDPVKDGYDFDGWYTNEDLTEKFTNSQITANLSLYAKHIPTEYKVTFDTDGGDKVDDIAYTVLDNVALPIAIKSGYIFTHWSDADGKEYHVLDKGSKGNISLKANYRAAEVTDITFSTLADTKNTGALTNKKENIFKVTAEVRGRIATWTNPSDNNDTITFSKSYKINSAGYYIAFTAPEDGKLSFYVQNGSSSASTQQVEISCNNGTSQKVTFSGTNAVAPYPSGSPIVKVTVDVLKGKLYTIKRVSGTIDIYAAELETSILEESISAATIQDTGKINYLEGEAFDASELKMAAVHGEDLYYSNIDSKHVVVDSSNVDMSKSGEYEVDAYYGQFKATYKIKVHEVVDTELGFNETYIDKNSYNGIYVNGKVKTIYKLNEELDTNYLTLIVNSKYNKTTKQFIVDDNISYSGFDSSTAGKKTVTVTYKTNNKEFKTTYDVYVVDTTPYVDASNNYVVTVDKAYTGVIGAKSDDKGNMFTTISQALEYLNSLNLATDSKKIINVSKGHYNEKLEINIPNLTMIGAATTKATYSKDALYNEESYNAATIIEWNSLYGIADEGGFSQVTDSTATVAVRESAVNFTIKNITLSNYWNCEEVFQDNISYLTKMGIAISGTVNDHRALALIVQADKFTMDSCTLLGYQDTVEFMTGRQFVYNTFISGNTDFIFGTNATTYFYNSEIFVNYKVGGAGYVTAYKGCNQGDTDYVEYGFIFDNCKFTADSRVTAKTFALGRPWGKYSNVMIMNSEIGAHISTTASGRYVSMSGTNPTDDTVSYKEYNNTGASAISATLTSVDVLTSDVALNYNNISKIYGTTNGLVTYTEAWVPTLYTQINQ